MKIDFQYFGNYTPLGVWGIIIEQHLPFASSTEYSFFSIGDSTRDIAYDTESDKIFEATFELDNKYQTVQACTFPPQFGSRSTRKKASMYPTYQIKFFSLK